MPIAQNRSHSAAVLELLCAQFPRCFSRDEARRQPLKIGVHNDVPLVLGDAVTPSELGRALQVHVNNRIYQSRLRPGVTRIDLNGETRWRPYRQRGRLHKGEGESAQRRATHRLAQIPKSSLSVRAVEAIDCALARSSALFFGVEKPWPVPL